MEIIPAIDLREGKVVRLRQGDYAKQTVYSADPVEVARRFEQAGAPRLHVVDLDGALAGSPRNAHVYRLIAGAVGIPIQVGGGLRTIKSVDDVMAMGADRAVLGTAAVSDPALVTEAIARHGVQRVVVGLDARDGKVAVQGWTVGTAVSAAELMERMAGLGVGRFVYTDIARDGTLTEPDLHGVFAMLHASKGIGVRGGWAGGPALIVSGGVGAMDHLKRLAAMGVEGAIVGSALYTGAIDLSAAIRMLR